VGALVMGAAADLFGLRAPLAFGALLALAAALWLFGRRRAIDRALEEAT